MFRKDYVRARKYGEEAYRLALATQDEQSVIDALGVLAYLKASDGHREEAEKDFEKIVRFNADRGLHRSAASAAVQLASVRRELGKEAAGLAALAEAKRHCLHSGEDQQTCLVVVGGHQANFEEQAARYEAAIRTLRETISLANSISAPALARYSQATLAETLAESGNAAEAEAALRELPDDGNWKPVKQLLRVKIAYFSKPSSIAPEKVETLLRQIANPDDRAAAQVLLAELQTHTFDGAKLQNALHLSPGLPQGAMRSEKMAFRLALAEGWLKLKKRQEAMAALGPFAEFEFNPFFAWRAAVLMAAAVPAENREQWLKNAELQWSRFEAAAGKEIAKQIRSNRHDLKESFAVHL